MLDRIYDDIYSYYNSHKVSDEDIYKIAVGVYEAMINNNLDPNEFKLLGDGESSLCFSNGSLVVKITFTKYLNTTLTDYVSHSKSILKPLYEKEIETSLLYNPSVIITKKLSQEGITIRDVVHMYVNLRDSGYLWTDTKIQNLGKDENNNMYLLDYGELIYIKNMTRGERAFALRTHEVVRKEYDEAYKRGSLGIDEFINKLEYKGVVRRLFRF